MVPESGAAWFGRSRLTAAIIGRGGPLGDPLPVMPEVKVGIPSVVEAALIPRLIGWGRARELLLLGEIIDADTALNWGLVERVVAPEALDREIDTIVAALLSAGPQALRIQKSLIREWENLPAERAIAAGIDAFLRAFDSDEPSRMLGAFAKRKR